MSPRVTATQSPIGICTQPPTVDSALHSYKQFGEVAVPSGAHWIRQGCTHPWFALKVRRPTQNHTPIPGKHAEVERVTPSGTKLGFRLSIESRAWRVGAFDGATACPLGQRRPSPSPPIRGALAPWVSEERKGTCPVSAFGLVAKRPARLCLGGF